MKNMLKNKKGFTLVELLAVIVILALLIVITANTILPMLGRTNETGMTTYAKRVLNNALTSIEADKIAMPLTADKTFYYRISNDLTNNDSYFGCVKVVYDHDGATKFTYDIKMFSEKDDLYMSASSITDVTDLGTITFEDYTLTKDKDDVEGGATSNCTAAAFAKMTQADPDGDDTAG